MAAQSRTLRRFSRFNPHAGAAPNAPNVFRFRLPASRCPVLSCRALRASTQTSVPAFCLCRFESDICFRFFDCRELRWANNSCSSICTVGGPP